MYVLLDKYVYYLQMKNTKETCTICCTRFCTVLDYFREAWYTEVHICKQLACLTIALPRAGEQALQLLPTTVTGPERGLNGTAAAAAAMDLYPLTLFMRLLWDSSHLGGLLVRARELES